MLLYLVRARRACTSRSALTNAFAGVRTPQAWFLTFAQCPRQESGGLNLAGTLDRPCTRTGQCIVLAIQPNRPGVLQQQTDAR